MKKSLTILSLVAGSMLFSAGSYADQLGGIADSDQPEMLDSLLNVSMPMKIADKSAARGESFGSSWNLNYFCSTHVCVSTVNGAGIGLYLAQTSDGRWHSY